ncbi:YlzJ-like family protein [Neobacillus sp. PS3-12]|jgi:hypothetical protein|uniref:YlzJ-like family protein n=1 Tax=Neobacillus sp. PS3-12 TaxID=3070677 RepID=UPI0027E18DF5|nr:YlzJ-like family protein [Neobacillus sp. PS3-12]WML52050.1 YlzJ-like family protein [Neobacillus sp. PS3-12]
MILYTTVPIELVFPYENDTYEKQKTINLNGIPLLVEYTDPQTIQIVRVLSSDPQHFMDDRYSPGTKISMFNPAALSSS